MAALLVALLCAAMAVLLWQIDSYGRTHASTQLLDTARAMSLAVDGQTRSYESMLDALRLSEALARGDIATFNVQARTLLSGGDEAWIVLREESGRQLVNTRIPDGAPLPQIMITPAQWSALTEGHTHYCDLTRGQLAVDVLCVSVPVVLGGETKYALSVIFRPRLFDRVFARERLRAGRFVTVVDRTGTVVWRNRSPERFIGRPARPDLLKALSKSPEGVQPSVSLEGVPTLMAYTRSQLTGWTFIVALPRSDVGALSERSLGYGLLGAALFLLVGAGVGLAAGRRVSRAVGGLGRAATRLRSGEDPAYQPSGLAEVDAVGEALDDAVRERDTALERFRLAQEMGGIGAWEWDVRTGKSRVSESFKEMHGLAEIPGQISFLQVRAMVHPDDLEAYDARVSGARGTDGPISVDYRVLRPDGSVRWIYAKGRALYSPAGEPEVALGVSIDLTDRKQTEERLGLLMREVDHRANNLMAVVQGAVALSRGRDAKELRENIIGRVQALARAHQLLAESRWRGADLRRLVEEELRPYALGDEDRVRIEGPPAPLTPAAAQGIAMALHELATNAAKHGALSVPGGTVSVSWQAQKGRLALRWAESGGPPVTAPQKLGFGATVLKRAVSGAVGGTCHLDWRPEGLVCDVELPVGEEP